MACTNCFNGCVEITSDQCVKYTGETISVLGITTGDTLAKVEQSITDYILTIITGEGIVPTDDFGLCALISDALPAQGTITLVDILNALSVAICSLQTQVTAATDALATLNGVYTLDCLDIIDPSGTHAVVQSIIDKLCETIDDVTALTSNLEGYVKISDLNDYIDAYLSVAGSDLAYLKMVPYTAVEYYGPLTGFDITGKGSGTWDKVYLCNGQNGTPDKRGRIPVGTTVMGSTAFHYAVDPALGNPTYVLNTTNGVNKHTLTEAEMPSHTHTLTTSVTDPGHTHVQTVYQAIADGGVKPVGFNSVGAEVSGPYSTKSSQTGITVSGAATAKGGSQPHPNVPPVLACHYIMYLP